MKMRASTSATVEPARSPLSDLLRLVVGCAATIGVLWANPPLTTHEQGADLALRAGQEVVAETARFLPVNSGWAAYWQSHQGGSGYSKGLGELHYEHIAATSTTIAHAFGEYYIAAIPPGVEILSASFGYCQYSHWGNVPRTGAVYVSRTHPGDLTAEQLFGLINLSPRISPAPSSEDTWNVRQFDTTGLGYLRSGLRSIWCTVGLGVFDMYSGGGAAYGHTYLPGAPYLEVLYSTLTDPDVCARAVISPDTVSVGDTVTPSALILNCGLQEQTLLVEFSIFKSHQLHYSDTTTVILTGRQLDTLEFRPWVAGPIGRFAAECRTLLPNDTNLSNDTARAVVLVYPGTGLTDRGSLADSRTLRLAPNPAKAGSLVHVFWESLSPARACFLDPSGRAVGSSRIPAGFSPKPMRLPRLAPGVYFVHLDNGGSTGIQRLIVTD
jgi:hypothetical protein